VPIRISISSVFDQFKLSGANTLQLPFPKNASEKWTILVLDLLHFFEIFKLIPDNYSRFSKLHRIESIQVCSVLEIRGIYTSDELYTIKTLPKELNFVAQKNQSWS